MHAVVVAAVGIEPAAVWLTVVWFLKSAPLIETLEAFAKVERPVTPQTSLARPECDSPATLGMKFCGECGHKLALGTPKRKAL